MDALTNVVAVLILVLLLVQADVSRKIADFSDELEPATWEQVDLARAELNNLMTTLDRKNQQLTARPPTPEEIETARGALAKLKENLFETQTLQADLEELRKLEKQLRAERDQAGDATSLVQQEIARVEGLLDATPVLTAPPPEEISIPNSRPIPSNAVIYDALVFNDRVHLIDPYTALDSFQDEFNKHRREFRIERLPSGGAHRYVHDQAEIVDHFSRFDFRAPGGQAISVLPNPYGTSLRLQILPDPVNGGTSFEELHKPGSPFEVAVRGPADDLAVGLLHIGDGDELDNGLVEKALEHLPPTRAETDAADGDARARGGARGFTQCAGGKDGRIPRRRWRRGR